MTERAKDGLNTAGNEGNAAANKPKAKADGAFHFLVRGSLARFASAWSVAESVQRLQQAQHNPPPSRFRNERVDGAVSAEQVRLTRVVPGRRNAMQPVFTGAWGTEAGHAVLAGRFAPRGAVQLFCALWFGFLLFFMALGVQAILTHGWAVWWTVGMGVLLFGAGWGFIAAGRRAGQADIDALSALIEGALRAPKAEHGPP